MNVVKAVTGEKWREFRHRRYCRKMPGVSSQEVLGRIGQSFVTEVVGKQYGYVLPRATGINWRELVSYQKVLIKMPGVSSKGTLGKMTLVSSQKLLA